MTYNYKKEIEKILKDKNITLYDNRFPEDDERRFKIFPVFSQRVDDLEKSLSEKINSKEEFIGAIESILETKQKSLKEHNENPNLIPLMSYEIGLTIKLMSLSCVFG